MGDGIDADGPDDAWDEGPGVEERLERGPWLRVLLRLALLSGVAWILSNGVLQVRFAIVTGSVFGSEGEARVLRMGSSGKQHLLHALRRLSGQLRTDLALDAPPR